MSIDMNCQRFDVGILECKDTVIDKANPLHSTIYQRTSTWMTHAVMFKSEQGDIWDARMAGIEDNHISDYKGRKLYIFEYAYEQDYEACEKWLAETLPKAESYDFLALLGFQTGISSFQNDNRWYCSELPYRMFQDTGHLITRVVKPFWYPSDFYFSPKFDLVWEGMV